MVIKCGGKGCDRLLYVQVEAGEQTIYCYLCQSANLITFKGGEGTDDDFVPEED